MITEALKMKVAECYQKDRQVKIVIATFHQIGGCLQLQRDMRDKYHLDYLMKQLKVEPKSMKQLSEGKYLIFI